MRENNRKPIEKCRKKLPQFTTMNVIDGQAGLVIYSSLIFYSLTIDNILNIIVLLILAGVTISALSGDNGILKNAARAKEESEQSSDIEKIKIAMSEAQIGESGYQELEVANFQEALNSQFEGRNLQLSDNGDGSFIIKLDNMSKNYYADSNGEIISNENILKISTIEELKRFRDDVNSGNTYEGWYIYLENDITLNINEEWKPIGIYVNEATSPDDSRNTYFSGIFDGKIIILKELI